MHALFEKGVIKEVYIAMTLIHQLFFLHLGNYVGFGTIHEE